MKFIPATISYFLQERRTQRNVRSLLRFLLLLVGMIVAYSIAFHYLMAAEGQQHSWITGFYWTLTVMSTLGFGDITFASDAGRAFSMLVLLSGVLFLLVVLPFTFIQFFYAPWLEAQSRQRAPRELPEAMQGHVIITGYDPVTISLIERLKAYGWSYVVLEGDVQRALALYDEGVQVMVADPENIESYRRSRAPHAALVVATGNDFLNTNIAFTVRELTERVPIVVNAREEDSMDVLQLAGASHVLPLTEMLGRALARRALAGETRASVIGRFGPLVIAEAPVTGTPLVGKTLRDSRIRETTGLTVVGLWERGHFEVSAPEMQIDASTVLVLVGSEAQIARFDELVCIYNIPDAPVLILGGGRVGRAAAAALQEREVDYRIVEQKPELIRDSGHYVLGSAADLETLERAGVREASSTLVTTNDDATNIYLTIYCRRLRPQMQIVSRATLERNVSTLHRAGADFVMSYASMGANAIFNILEQGDVVMLAEGLDMFRFSASPALVGKSLAESGIREATGCSVAAIETRAGIRINPPPDLPIPAHAELILVGTTENERRFIERYGSSPP